MTLVKAVWRSASTISGGLYVMMVGILEMLGWYAGNWDSLTLPVGAIFINKLIMLMLISSVVTAYDEATFGEGTGPIHLNDVQCFGFEAVLVLCQNEDLYSCEHSEDAGVRCQLIEDIGKISTMPSYISILY